MIVLSWVCPKIVESDTLITNKINIFNYYQAESLENTLLL